MLRAIYHYLKHRFGRFLANISSENGTDESRQLIDPDEVCARFLFDSNEFSFDSVKDKAFKPNAKTNNVSIYISSRFASQQDFEITRQNVTEKRGRSLKAQAEFLACAVDDVRDEVLDDGILTSIRLSLDERANPHDETGHQHHLRGNPHHANIEGWPADKQHQILIQKALAARCRLVKFGT